jgi:hypothetical protein
VVTDPVMGPGECTHRPKAADPRAEGPRGQTVAVAFDADGHLLVQTREPAALVVDGYPIAWPGASVADTGHRIFHLGTFNGIACASCHPEGHEDGHIWNFSTGTRRTQSLRGQILGTEPFHWSGDDPDFDAAVHQVLGSVPFGTTGLGSEYVQMMARWVDTLPALTSPPPLDPIAADRGRALFHDPAVGCANCHTGSKLTNNQSVDVGTGEAFQVPSLIGVGWRAPFLHDGCAPTLADRFGSCGGGEAHGHTSALGGDQLGDLIAYLETL